jgi:hypothetical protein
MGNVDNRKTDAEATGETTLRGAGIGGADQTQAVDHVAKTKKRNPDAVLRLDGEKDTLYEDGIEVEDDSESLFDTHGLNK